ncbi:MAG: ATP-binding protein [Candidatus Gastranaerophilaceae bacterium]
MVRKRKILQKKTAPFTDFIVKEIERMRMGEKRLMFDFLSGICVIMLLSSLITGVFIFASFQKLNDKYAKRIFLYRDTIAQTAADDFLSRVNYFKSPAEADAFIQKYKLSYFAITDAKTGSTMFSTIPAIIRDDGTVNKTVLRENHVADTDTFVKHGSGYNIYAGFGDNFNVENIANTFFASIVVVFGICFLLALWLAMCKMNALIRAIKSIKSITGEFAKGDLSNRLERTNYSEINELTEDFNKMADSMQKLYSSLEKRVQERSEQLKDAIKEIQSTQAMMVHSEKMKSLGELVAGIMHEVNNPVNFIYGNLTHLKNYSKDLITIIDEFKSYEGELSEEHRAKVDELMKQIDYEFLKTDLPDLIDSCHEGTERVKNIVLDLKDFSRMEEAALTSVDLAKEIDTTLNILYNKFKYKITVHKEYEPNMPKIEAYGGQLNQVFMNILDNAAYAVSDKERGDVYIRLRTTNKYAVIEIEDNGKGMDAKTRDKIFNPFFTTKPVGQGSGLGLSISYKVIKNHKGNIEVYSTPGKGTKFIITLPLVTQRENPETTKEVK